MLTNVSPIFWSGQVVHGFKRGRTLGFPTANILLDQKKPDPGTYGGMCLLGTFEEYRDDDCGGMVRRLCSAMVSCVACYREGTDVLEVHCLDWSGDLYNKTLTVSLNHRIRDNRIFVSEDAIRNQIVADCQYWRQKKIVVMNFGTFDLIHHGHVRLLRCSRMMGTSMHTVVSHDAHRKHDTCHTSEERKNLLIALGFDHHTVWVGDERDYLAIPHHVRPHVFVVGYDQYHAQDILAMYQAQASCMSLPPYRSDLFKSSLLR